MVPCLGFGGQGCALLILRAVASSFRSQETQVNTQFCYLAGCVNASKCLSFPICSIRVIGTPASYSGCPLSVLDRCLLSLLPAWPPGTPQLSSEHMGVAGRNSKGRNPPAPRAPSPPSRSLVPLPQLLDLGRDPPLSLRLFARERTSRFDHRAHCEAYEGQCAAGYCRCYCPYIRKQSRLPPLRFYRWGNRPARRTCSVLTAGLGVGGDLQHQPPQASK